MQESIRLQFSKKDTLKFIGHLDLQRIFNQTIRRAGLPAAYSQGFNPHILLSFALPLPLGMESENDYADLVLAAPLPMEEIEQRLNAAAPKGLKIKKAYKAEGKRSAATTIAADYIFKKRMPLEKITAILEKETIIAAKKTKSGIKKTDVKCDIIDIWQEENNVILRLAAGSSGFLNPLIVAELLLEAEASNTMLCRKELYQSNGLGGLSNL